jgi:hypothetical protein
MAAVMVAMLLAAGPTPAMAQVVLGDGSCDTVLEEENGFFFCDGSVDQDGVSQGLSTRSNSGTVSTSFTVSHTP